MKKLLAIALCAIMILGGAAAFAEAGDKPYAGTTITVVTTGSGPVFAADKHLSTFEEATGITVNLEQYEFSDAIRKVAVNAAAGGTGIDVFSYRPIQEQQTYTNNGWFAPLDAYIEAANGRGYDYEDFFPASREITTAPDGTVYGIPYLVEGEILWINAEILAKIGKTEPPKNLDELLEYCELAYDPANNQYGIAIRGEGNQAVTQFSGFLYAFGGDFFDPETYTATMNTPEALEALEYYAKLLTYGPDGILSATMETSRTWFCNGLTLFRIDAYTQNAPIVDPEQSVVFDKVAYAYFPEGKMGYTPYNITAWAWAISATSEKKDAAWAFIEWISGHEMDVEGMVESGFSARNSTWSNPVAIGAVPPQLAEVVAHTGAVGRKVDRPFCVNASEVRAIVGELIDAANSGLTGDALKAVADEKNAKIQAILDSEKPA